MEPKIIVLSIPYWNNQQIHPVLLYDENNLILVDCGDIKSLNEIEKEIVSHGFEPENVTGIILTHQDFDHMGSAAAFKRKYPNVKIYASAEEEPYISGKKKGLRLCQAEELQKSLPPEEQETGKNFRAMLSKVEPVEVDIIIKEGDFFDWCGGCQIIDTSGHTPGHISLYLPKQKIAITGDAAFLTNGKLEIPNPQYSLDFEKAKRSFKKLLKLDVDKFLCYHVFE